MQCIDLTIRLPIGIHDSTFKIRKTVEEFSKQFGREPTLEELSEHSNLTPDEIQIATNAPRALTSLDRKANESEDSSFLIEIIADEKNSNTIEDAENRANIEEAYAAIESYLDGITKMVVLERVKDPPTPWKDICQATGLSRGRLQKIEQNGLDRCALLLKVRKELRTC